MDKIRRNERMSVMMKTLTDAPNHIFTLNYFGELFGTAKSTVSEDIDLLQQVIAQYGLGQLETVTGAAGGVRYRPVLPHSASLAFVQELCDTLSGTERVLPGDFLYNADILSRPDVVRRMGCILAGEYYDMGLDFVVTMETKGIPVAMTTAEALGIPLVIARRSAKVYEGSAVNINYVTASSGHIETMSLSRRAVKEGQRCLVVDDFLKGGGTARGMVELMREFQVEVCGMAFVMATENPKEKLITGEKSLMTIDILPGTPARAVVRPAEWLKN